MDRSHASRQTGFAASALGALAACLLALAVPGRARAGDEFEDGFKDELGRLAAHQAVFAGRSVLSQVLLAGHPGDSWGQPHHRRGYDRHDDDGYRRNDHQRHYRPGRFYAPYGHHGYREHHGWGGWRNQHRHGHRHGRSHRHHHQGGCRH